MKLELDDHFNQELPADPELTNQRRQVRGAAFSYVSPRVPSAPKLLHASNEVAQLIGLSAEDLTSKDFLEVFSGARVPDGARPYAMCYGGHQFGNWAGQLGDGRAINLCEVEHQNKRWTLQLKGAGETPYSRTADGLAVLRSSLREHLCSEAMFHLGVPTTRSLSLIVTGDDVMRDMMYDGNAALEPGAVVCRVAPSFIRFGNFQIFAANGDIENLRRLADYTIKHHFPAVVADHDSDSYSADHYINLFRRVTNLTLDMVIHWQRVGFVHGVMNTDNMSIHGDTIDFGPYGWLEGFDNAWTPNTTDRQHRRYRYGHQPQIALWNLLQLANALYPLVEDAEPLQEILHEFQSQFEIKYKSMMGEKIGLSNVTSADYELLVNLEQTLQLTETDMTMFFRLLARVPKTSSVPTAEGEDDALDFAISMVTDAFYEPAELTGDVMASWRDWFRAYQVRLNQTELSDADRATKMNRVNPKYVLRNYMAQLAIDKATAGDVSLIDELYQLLKQPYDEQPESEEWFAKRPEWARHKVGCSMLSCSS